MITKEPALDLNRYVGLRLKLRRRVLKVSMEALAEAADVSRQQVQKYEAGINRISAVTLFRMAQHLQVPITYFFEGLSIEEGDPFPADLDAAPQQRVRSV